MLNQNMWEKYFKQLPPPTLPPVTLAHCSVEMLASGRVLKPKDQAG